jgi:hypothetical protein
VEEETMKGLITSVLLVGTLGIAANPRPADAQPSLEKCLIGAVKSCNADFEGGNPYTIAARGYCYMIRTGMCKLIDKE